MTFFKRIFLFLIVNVLIITTISIILNLLNVQPFLNAHGLDYQSLMIFCLIWGFGGAFISLAISRMMAKWMLGVRVIDPRTADATQRHLVETVHQLARAAGLSVMPQVGIYNSPEVNAFATGPSRRRSLVAVSSGLLNRMSQDELEGVLGHEISHISNGDMVTMTLIQGVVNAFVMFLARALAYALSGIGNRGKSSGNSYLMFNVLVIVFQIVFMILGSLVVAAYSRYREFRADKGGASLAGRDKMISALESLKKLQEIRDVKMEKPAFQSMKISHQERRGLIAFFATHPSLELRIERLRKEKA
ncbi:MAG TPA: protease HtpX [Rhabdochlamydiaceae bacterium]|nr:protease HtpX [Rhabdochlamydiaceae bacterium]